MNVATIGMPGPAELLVILGIAVLLFGAKKIPQLAKGIGESIRELRKATKDEEEVKPDAGNES